MMGQDLVRPDPDRHGALRMTDAARPILRGEEAVHLREDVKEATERSRSKRHQPALPEEDRPLWEALRTLRKALADPAHDRHRLRLLIKRARYGDEAYPQLDHAGKKLQRLLKKAQSDLGDWHDRLQWLLQDAQARLAARRADRLASLQAELGGKGVKATAVDLDVQSGASITSVPTGTGWSCTPSGGYPLSSGNVTCTRTGTLASGASASVLTVPAVSNVNGTVTAAFAIDGIKPDNSAMPDGNTSNNTTSADVTSTSGADVSITKTAASSNVAQGANVV